MNIEVREAAGYRSLLDHMDRIFQQNSFDKAIEPQYFESNIREKVRWKIECIYMRQIPLLVLSRVLQLEKRRVNQITDSYLITTCLRIILKIILN